MSISLFSVVIVLIFLTVSAIEIYRGTTRGFYHALISLGTLVPSTCLALLITPFFSEEIVSMVFRYIIEPLPVYQQWLPFFPSLTPFLQGMAQIVLNVVLVVVVTLLLRLLLRFMIFAFTNESWEEDKEEPTYAKAAHSFCHRHSALLGGIVGGICAIIISILLTCPIMGALHVADDVIQIAESYDPTLWSATTLSEEDVDNIKAYPNDLPGNLFYELGGDALFKAAARANIYGHTVYLHQELQTVEETYWHFTGAYEALLNPTLATPEHLAHLDGMRDGVTQLNLCHGIISDYFAQCAQYWLDGLSYYGIAKPQLPEIAEPIFDQVLSVCASSTADTIKDNAATILNIYRIILESNILNVPANDYTALIACLEETHLITRLDAELSDNPNMRHIRISAMGMQLLFDTMQQYSYTEQQYTAACESISKALNTVRGRGYGSIEEQVEVLHTYVDKYFTELGVTLPAIVSEAIASELTQLPLDGNEEITADQVQAFFNKYQ